MEEVLTTSSSTYTAAFTVKLALSQVVIKDAAYSAGELTKVHLAINASVRNRLHSETQLAA